MSISDMMSGLMLVFLFISISFMLKVDAEKKEMESVALEYRDTKANLNEALYEEFEDELEKWGASITQDNRIVFDAPEVLFDVSESHIKSEFQTILKEFFPRLMQLLGKKEFQSEILELRVEGYTSKSWGDSSKEEAYLKNMKLSQERALSVLTYCYSLEDESVLKQRSWLEGNFRANGMAYSKQKSEKKARRVEFSVQMKSEDSVYKILSKRAQIISY